MSRTEFDTEVAIDLVVALDLCMDLFCILLHSEGPPAPESQSIAVTVVLADDKHLVREQMGRTVSNSEVAIALAAALDLAMELLCILLHNQKDHLTQNPRGTACHRCTC